MSDIKINVPFYRQNDLTSDLNSYWQNRACGLLALKMVVDYYRKKEGKKPVDLGEIFKKAVDNGGLNDTGDWYNYAFVKTAIDYGFHSWRRGWTKAPEDIKIFKNEGLDEKSLTLWQEQEKSEAVPTLLRTLETKHPVLVSVEKNFDEINQPHFIVLTGIKYSEDAKALGFYYHDPYSPEIADRKHRYVSLDTFEAKWNYRAIFIEPARAR